MDSISPEKRSLNMGKICAKNTKPEIIVRSLLHSLGYRFRIHSEKLPGHPDIVLPKYKTIIFVHGCFWHRHKKCKYAYTPKTRTEFWNKKFSGNIRRDREVQCELKQLGWRVLIIWECEISDKTKLTRRIRKALPM